MFQHIFAYDAVNRGIFDGQSANICYEINFLKGKEIDVNDLRVNAVCTRTKIEDDLVPRVISK